MDIEGFWALIERSASATTGKADRLAWIEHKLIRVGRTHIEDFQILLHTQRARIDTWPMTAAAELVCGDSISDDGFWYFQPWLIGQGRAVLDRVAADPDALADVPAVRALAGYRWDNEEWPEWEGLEYVARSAYPGGEDAFEDALDARGITLPCLPARHEGDYRDFRDRAGKARHFPRLAALFEPRPASR